METYLDKIKRAVHNIETNSATKSDWETAQSWLYYAYCVLEVLPKDILSDEDFAKIDDILCQTRYKVNERWE